MIKMCLYTKHLSLAGNQPQANVQFYTNAYVEKCFGRLSRIFVHISNYTKNYVRDNSLFGTPVQRPLFMEFPDDPISWTISYQYMFGDDLIVAPVIQSGVTTMKVYLPKGQWRSIWDTKVYGGGQFVTVDAPLGKPPAFYENNSEWGSMFAEIQTKFPLIPAPVVFSTKIPTNGMGTHSMTLTTILVCVLSMLCV